METFHWKQMSYFLFRTHYSNRHADHNLWCHCTLLWIFNTCSGNVQNFRATLLHLPAWEHLKLQTAFTKPVNKIFAFDVHWILWISYTLLRCCLVEEALIHLKCIQRALCVKVECSINKNIHWRESH